jgi:hypothetical protein
MWREIAVASIADIEKWRQLVPVCRCSVADVQKRMMIFNDSFYIHEGQGLEIGLCYHLVNRRGWYFLWNCDCTPDPDVHEFMQLVIAHAKLIVRSMGRNEIYVNYRTDHTPLQADMLVYAQNSPLLDVATVENSYGTEILRCAFL